MDSLNLTPEATYEVQEILNQIKKKGAKITDQRARWILFELERKGFISRVGKKIYCVQPRVYSYNDPSETLQMLKAQISSEFPSLDFALMETRQLNEWVNLLIAKNIIFVEVESGTEAVVFSYLQEHLGKERMILLCPDEEMVARYSSPGLIIVKKLFSRAPLNHKNHLMSLEQMSVDMLVDKDLKSMLGGAIYEVVEGIHKSYDIDVSATLNYASRRRCKKELLNIWEGKND